jgi:hypothetical protein
MSRCARSSLERRPAAWARDGDPGAPPRRCGCHGSPTLDDPPLGPIARVPHPRETTEKVRCPAGRETAGRCKRSKRFGQLASTFLTSGFRSAEGFSAVSPARSTPAPWARSCALRDEREPGIPSARLSRLPQINEPLGDTPEAAHEKREPQPGPSVGQNADRAAVGVTSELYHEGRAERRAKRDAKRR